MNILRLCYLLIALLVFQTAVAFYDSHEELQDIATHVEPHHLDSFDGSPDGIEPAAVADHYQSTDADQSANALDFCHHCCHCHSCGFVALMAHWQRPVATGIVAQRDSFVFSIPPGHFVPFFRPPIAQV